MKVQGRQILPEGSRKSPPALPGGICWGSTWVVGGGVGLGEVGGEVGGWGGGSPEKPKGFWQYPGAMKYKAEGLTHMAGVSWRLLLNSEGMWARSWRVKPKL